MEVDIGLLSFAYQQRWTILVEEEYQSVQDILKGVHTINGRREYIKTYQMEWIIPRCLVIVFRQLLWKDGPAVDSYEQQIEAV